MNKAPQIRIFRNRRFRVDLGDKLNTYPHDALCFALRLAPVIKSARGSIASVAMSGQGVPDYPQHRPPARIDEWSVSKAWSVGLTGTYSFMIQS